MAFDLKVIFSHDCSYFWVFLLPANVKGCTPTSVGLRSSPILAVCGPVPARVHCGVDDPDRFK
jgi:hypothetical protein